MFTRKQFNQKYSRSSKTAHYKILTDRKGHWVQGQVDRLRGRGKSYKYELKQAFACETRMKGYRISTKYIWLDTNGRLIAFRHYRWDGASGIAIDTANAMDGSCAHDCGYQLIRLGLVPRSFRKLIDKDIRDINYSRGMSWFRSRAWYLVLRCFGWLAI